MEITKATREFEAWVARHIPVVRDQLAAKHKMMADERIEFLRGSFYRWAQVWPRVCPDLAKSARVLAVGDLHVASYGTWRDAFGRLVWGIDDFDEAYSMPYASDLVRLATSALICASDCNLAVGLRNICDVILDGYSEGLKSGGAPFVLEERYKWLRTLALKHLDEPAAFWKTLDALPSVKKEIPAGARQALESILPEPRMAYRVARRTAGTGSMGHPRFVAIADWKGGQIALEAKAALPSSYVWATGARTEEILYDKILRHAARSPDPAVCMQGKWLVRRLSPDSAPIELESLAKQMKEDRLLHAMGAEAANIHLGSSNASNRLSADLRKRRASWLRAATKDMLKTVTDDWKEWKGARR